MALLQLPFFDINSIAPFIKAFSIIMLPFGVLLLLYGYKLFKIFLAFIGFIFGFLIGFVVGSFIGEPIVPGLLGGILCAFLFYVLYKIGIFVLGMIIGLFIGGLLIMISGSAEPALVIIFAIAGGIFALILEKFLIILFSSYQGASIVVSGLGWIFYPEYYYRGFALMSRDFNAYANFSLTVFLITLILMIIGMLYQYEAIPNHLDKHLPEFIRDKVDSEPEEFSESEKTFEKMPQNSGINNEAIKKEFSHVPDSNSDFLQKEKLENNQPFQRNEKVQKTDFTSLHSKTDHSQPKNAAELYRDTNYNHDFSSTESVANKYPSEPRRSPEIIEFPLYLEVLSEPQQGHQFQVRGTFNGKYFTSTIGRETTDSLNHIHLPDPDHYVSRYHGEFAFRNQLCYVRSLSHTNPLLLNDSELNKMVFEPIQNNDIIKMGNIKLKVTLR